MPFYDSNKNVVKFFDKLIHSNDDLVRLNTATILLLNKKPVADSVLAWFAERDKWRGKLYSKLEQIKMLDKFPPGIKHN
jgi:hypothetical protein